MRRAFLFPLIVLFIALVSINGLEDANFKTLKNALRISESLKLLFPVNIPKARTSESDPARTAECTNQVTLLQQGLMKGSTWALQMIDSSSKITSGLAIGNRRDLGMFDECMEIRANEDGHEIRGRHCMYDVTAEFNGLPMSQTLSICMPAVCEPEDIDTIMSSNIKLIGKLLSQNTTITVGQTTCTSMNPPEWTAGGIVTVTGLSLLLLFLVVCTIYDIYVMYSNEKPLPNGRLATLRRFSLHMNAARILRTKSGAETLPALQGLRFFSMVWVIMGHAHIMAFFQATVNPVELMRWAPTWASLYIIVAPFSVDTFLTISGFLMSYIFLKEMSSGQSFNLFRHYLHRYLRLTPAVAALLLITIFISPRVGSGALWENGATFEEQDCRSNWWTLLLYIHNYVKATNQGCLGHTWYLAVEMQFFWFSPLILYPLGKKPKIGLAVLAATFIASVAGPVIIGYEHKYSSAILSGILHSEDGNFVDYINNFYFASHVRAAPWLVGIFFGYLTFTQKGSPTRKATKWFGWLGTIAGLLFCVFTMRIFENENYEYNYVWEAIYTAISKPLWAFAVSWIMYASSRGFGGPVSTFLSFPIYNPLSRISYCTYLVHYQVQYIKSRAARTVFYFTPFTAFDRFLSDMVLSILFGFLLTLLVETPFAILDSMLLKRKRRPKDNAKKAVKLGEIEKGVDNSCLAPS